MTPTQQFILGLIGNFVVLTGILLSHLAQAHKLAKLEVNIDGRLSQLIESRAAQAGSEGELKGAEDERVRQRSEPGI